MSASAYNYRSCSIKNQRPGIWRYARELATSLEKAHRETQFCYAVSRELMDASCLAILCVLEWLYIRVHVAG